MRYTWTTLLVIHVDVYNKGILIRYKYEYINTTGCISTIFTSLSCERFDERCSALACVRVRARARQQLWENLDMKILDDTS